MFKSLKSKLKSWLGKEEISSPKDSPSQQSEKGEDKSESDSKKATPKKEKVAKVEKKPEKKETKKKETKEKKTEKETSKATKIETKKKEEKEVEEKPAKTKVEEKPEVKEEAPQKETESESDSKKESDSDKEDDSEKEEKPVEKKKGFFSRMFGSKDEVSSPKDSPSQQSEKGEDKSESDSEIEKKKVEKEPEPLDETIEDIEEEVEDDKKGFFAKLTSAFKGETTLTHDHVDEIFDDLEMILLENNVALEVVDKIKEELTEELVGSEIKKEVIEEKVITALKDAINKVLIEPPDLVKTIKEHDGLYTIIFFGINGSGKTTSVAKLAHRLKEAGIDCVLAAADTFRAAAIQQLETHAKKLDIPIIKHDYEADPTAVAFDAQKFAEKKKAKCLLIDTAGRMYTKDNLIKQMEKMIRVIKPNLKIFVGESITGNDGTQQAKTFHEAVGIDGIILSKADVDEKAGTILSVSYITGKPIYFLGVGQNYDDLQPFTKETVLKNLGLQ